jgi:pimeloyl-ACP methyl ester carboxylesterase
VVVVLRDDGRALRAPRPAGPADVVDHVVTERAGRWGLAVAPGHYAVAAFQDADADGMYADEPCRPPSTDTCVALAAGERREDLELVVPPDGRPGEARLARALAGLRARTPEEQVGRTLDRIAVVDGVTSLDDPRFTSATGRMGIWRPLDFTLTQRPGLWFTGPCDPARTAVLFVHGVGGHAREFERLAAHLDPARFQPCYWFYPSGADLGMLGRVLARTLVRLREACGVRGFVVVGHSMGGLVARAAVLEYDALTGRPDVRLLLTLACPFGGDERAAQGVADAPDVFPMPGSFRDVAAGSLFLDGLFFHDPLTRRERRRLPDHVAAWLLHAEGDDGSGVPGDGVLTRASMLRPEAVEEARVVRAVHATHAGILRDPAAAALLERALADAAR